MNLDTLFFVTLWAWMRAHPGADCDEFIAATARAVRLIEAEKDLARRAT